MKPAKLEVEYTVIVEYDIEELERELGIKWEDVKDYWSKWGFLNIELRSGDTRRVLVGLDDKLSRLGHWREPFKYPCSHTVYTEDYDVIDSRDR